MPPLTDSEKISQQYEKFKVVFDEFKVVFDEFDKELNSKKYILKHSSANIENGDGRNI